MPTDTDDAVALYCDTAADDEVPPKLEYCKWPRHDTSKYVSTCEEDICMCPRMYPTGAGGWTTAVGMKHPQWIRHLLFSELSHMFQVHELYAEHVLHACNDIECHRDVFFGHGADNDIDVHSARERQIQPGDAR